MSTSKSDAERLLGKSSGPLWAKEIESLGTDRVGFFSQLQGMKVVDSEGTVIGKIHDMSLKPGESLLEISRMVFTINILGEKVIVPMANVCSIDCEVKLDLPRDELPPGKISEKELLVTETLLDKQIVDIDGLKVVRVNDVLLAPLKGALCVVGVDVGFRGILRRLGLSCKPRQLLDRLPNRIIPSWYIDPLDPELRRIHLKIPRKGLSDLHPADIADIIEELNNKDRVRVLQSLGPETAAETMEEVEPAVQATMMNQMSSDQIAYLLKDMNPDDAADLLSMISKEKVSEILAMIDSEEAQEIKTLMGYSDRTAGSLMTTDFVWVWSDCKVSDVFARLRRAGEDIDMIYYIYVLNEKEQILGVLSLRDLLLADPETMINEVMKKEVISVLPTADIDEVANLLSKYDFLSVPVVDADGKMLGIVTFDDALEAVIPDELRNRLPWNYHKIRRVRAGTV